MNLEPGQIMEISIALFGAILLLVAAYSVPLKVSVAVLLVLIPFQPVETRFGTANIIMTYVLFGALVLRRRLQYFPMLGPVIAVILVYLLTISQLHRALYFTHGLTLLFLISGLLMFFLAYNLAREVETPRYIINAFIVANVVSVLYCLTQFFVGPGEKLVFFGINELWMHRNRGGGDPRLVGPLGTPGLTAAYFMTMTVLLMYEVMHSNRMRRVLVSILAAANVAMMIGTGNRGSFIVLVASLLWFIYAFRSQLGLARIVQVLVGSTVVLVAAMFVVSSYTDFGSMLNRLESTTQLEGGLPDTRQHIWPRAWSVIQEKPWLGHGPKIAPEQELQRRSLHPEQLVMNYPHNLYLHLLVTVGAVGTAIMLFFLFGVVWRVYRGARYGRADGTYEQGLPLLGVIVLVGILVDEMKIEFLREGTVDYAHFVLAVFGVFLGWADRTVMALRSGKGISDIEIRTYVDNGSSVAAQHRRVV